MFEKSPVHQAVRNHLDQSQFKEALPLLEKWNSEQLATFISHYPKSLGHMDHEIFDGFWAQRLESLRLPTEPSFRFKEQPGLKNSQFVGGYLLFLLSLKASSAPENGTLRRLFRDNDFFSFHLMRKQLHTIFLSLPSASEDDLSELAQILYNLEAFAKRHGTPGYLLMANGYMQLATHFQRLNSTEPSSDEIEQSQRAFQLCLQYLYMAQFAEDESEASINNAYFGKGVVLATPFKLLTIEEMKDYCCRAAGSLFSPERQKAARTAAELMYQNCINLRSEDKVEARP